MGLLQVRTTTSDHSVFLLSFVVEQEQGPKNNYCPAGVDPNRGSEETVRSPGETVRSPGVL